MYTDYIRNSIVPISIIACIIIYYSYNNAWIKKSKVIEKVNKHDNKQYHSINIKKSKDKQKQYSSIELKCIKDRNKIVKKIYSKLNKEDYVGMCRKGPPKETGFMWCRNEDWKDEKHRDAFKDVKNMVLDNGWDSGGYAMMMRAIQAEIIAKDVICEQN